MRDYRTVYLRSYLRQKINQANGDEIFMCSFTSSELEYFEYLLDLKEIYTNDVNDLLYSLIEKVTEIKESLQQYVGKYDLPLKQQVDLNYILYCIEGLKIHCKQHIKE